VPLEFSEILYNQVQQAGKPVELYTYDGDNHNLSNYFSMAMGRTIDFYNTYLNSGSTDKGNPYILTLDSNPGFGIVILTNIIVGRELCPLSTFMADCVDRTDLPVELSGYGISAPLLSEGLTADS